MAQSKAPLPGPAAPVVQARVWPPAVYLGERFAYRATLRATPGLKLLPVGTLRIGQAQLQGKVQVQRRQDRVILKLPLAIFLVRRYGPQKLPPFALMFQTSSGSKRLWLPGATFEVRARYAATRGFRLRQDPKLPFVKTSATPTPSHEWRALPAPPPKAGEAPLPLSWMLGGGALLFAAILWGFAMWQRRRPVVVDPAPSPFDTARTQLQALGQMPVADREGVRKACTQSLHILRDYLHQRLPTQTRHLTSHELCQFFAQAPAQPLPGAPHPPPWFGGLQTLLHQSEPICFAPSFVSLNPAYGLPTQLQQTLQLLDTIEAWQKDQEQRAAAASDEAFHPHEP